MRSLDDAREAWLVLKTFTSVRELKDAVRPGPKGSVAVNGLRSACWMTFLLFDTLDMTVWQKTLTSSRSAYDSLRSHFLRFIENPDEVNLGFDPLSQESEV
jgi:TBC1 domain family protein 5